MNIFRNLSEYECYKCGIIFWVTDQIDRAWRRDKSTFHCPNGHGQNYTKSTAETLQEEVARKKERIEYLETENARLEKKLKRKKK